MLKPMLADNHMAISISGIAVLNIATLAIKLVVVAAETNVLTAIGISAEQ